MLPQTSGQAAVETALTLPLTLFMVLGALQLFMMLQARLMTEHAAFTSTRAGALAQGSCARMTHAALLTLLPTFTRTDTPARVAAAFDARKTNKYQPGIDWGHTGSIVWVIRVSPTAGTILGNDDEAFDSPDRAVPITLETRLVFWYPLRIPFANWVLARSVLAAWGGPGYDATNPLIPSQTSHWTADGSRPAAVDALIFAELAARTGNPSGTYVFPIQATAATRMMTAPRRQFFAQAKCP